MNAAATRTKPEVSTAPATPAPSIRILKINSCPSLSGKSTLTYHIGCNEQSELFFRVYANSSSGYFSREWVACREQEDFSPLRQAALTHLL